MKTRNIIGGAMFVIGLAAATTIEGSLWITFGAIALMVCGGIVCKAFDFQNE